jgi:hypothetical protein
LLHGKDYEEGKRRVEDYKHVATALKKGVYNFYDEMNSTNTIDHLENLKSYTIKNGLWKRLILIWDNASYHLSMTLRKYINTQKDWLTIIHLPKKAPYLNPNE